MTSLPDGTELFHLSIKMPEGTTGAQDYEVSQRVQEIVKETTEQGQREGWGAELVRNLIMGRIKAMLPEGYEAQFLDGDESARKFRDMLEEATRAGNKSEGANSTSAAPDDLAQVVARMLGKAEGNGARPRDRATPIDVAVFGIRAGSLAMTHAMLDSARDALRDAANGVDALEEVLKQQPDAAMGLALLNAKIALAGALAQHVRATVLWTGEADLVGQRRVELFEDDGTDPVTVPFGVSRGGARDSPEAGSGDGPEAAGDGTQDSPPPPEGIEEADFREV